MISKNLFYILLYTIIFIFLFIKICETKSIYYNPIETYVNNTKKNSIIQNTQNKHIIINFSNKEFGKKMYSNNYLKTMNKLNINLRGFKSKKELYDFYLNNSLINITEEEEEIFRYMIIKLLKKINNMVIYNFIKRYLIKITIVKSNNKLESGMPHTHNKTIIFPQSYFNSIKHKYNLNFMESMLENEGLTFIHEILHIHQRLNKQKYLKMYNLWGFTKPSYINNMNEFNERNRHNPDGLKVDWVWKNNNKYYLIGAIFNNNSISLTDTDYVAKEITRVDENIFNNNIKDLIHLNKFNNFINYFGINNNNYHPNEIASQYFEYYINQNFLKNYINIKNKIYLIFKKKILHILN